MATTSPSQQREYRRVYEKAWRERNREKLNEQARARRASDPLSGDSAWASNLRRKFDLTPAEYAAMLKSQNGVCAICAQPERAVQRGKVRRLSVDHDHATGAVRSLLCQTCNAMLGQAGDSIERLVAGAAYLMEHSLGN